MKTVPVFPGGRGKAVRCQRVGLSFFCTRRVYVVLRVVYMNRTRKESARVDSTLVEMEKGERLNATLTPSEWNLTFHFTIL